jgi:hypothetical protein
MAKNQFLMAFSDGSNLSEPYSFEIFGKSFFYQNSVEQGTFARKTVPFFRKNWSKIRNKLWIFKIFFFTILNSCSTNVHTQKWI